MGSTNKVVFYSCSANQRKNAETYPTFSCTFPFTSSLFLTTKTKSRQKTAPAMSSPVPETSPTAPVTNSTSPPPRDTTNSTVFQSSPPPTNTSVNTPPVPPPPAAEAPRSSTSSTGPSTPLLAALIAGIVLGVLAGVGISVCVYRRKKRKDAQRLLLAGQPSQGTSKGLLFFLILNLTYYKYSVFGEISRCSLSVSSEPINHSLRKIKSSNPFA